MVPARWTSEEEMMDECCPQQALEQVMESARPQCFVFSWVVEVENSQPGMVDVFSRLGGPVSMCFSESLRW